MKKKIKDLTLGECKRICSKMEYCSHCPILIVCPFRLDNYEEMSDLEREVKIDESNND